MYKWVEEMGMERRNLSSWSINLLYHAMLFQNKGIFFNFKGKKTMWIVEIFCEERKRQKALDPKLKENQRLEFSTERRTKKMCTSSKRFNGKKLGKSSVRSLSMEQWYVSHC